MPTPSLACIVTVLNHHSVTYSIMSVNHNLNIKLKSGNKSNLKTFIEKANTIFV